MLLYAYNLYKAAAVRNVPWKPKVCLAWSHGSTLTCVVLNGPCLAGQHTPLELCVAVVLPVAERLVRTPAKLTVKTVCWELFSGEGQTDTKRKLTTSIRKAINSLLGNIF